MANNLSPIPLSTYVEIHTDGRARGHSLKLKKHRCKSEVRGHFFFWEGCKLLEYAGSGQRVSDDSKWFQDKAGEGKIKEDGPVFRLKSAGPRGRSSYEVDGRTCELPVSYTVAGYTLQCSEHPHYWNNRQHLCEFVHVVWSFYIAPTGRSRSVGDITRL